MVPRRPRTEAAAEPTADELRRRLERCACELAECRERLHRLEGCGTAFLAAAAHAMNNPLTIAHSYLELVVSDLPDGLSDDQRSFLEAARDAVRRLALTLGDLTERAALETGAAEAQWDEVLCSEVLERVAEAVRSLAEKAGVALSSDAAADLGMLTVDRGRLEDALRRLLARAVAETPAGGRVTLGARRLAAELILEVRDGGRPIAEDRLRAALEPFAAAAGTAGGGRKADPNLAIARRQVEVCGGRLEAEPTARGSVLRIRLPVKRADV
jgi:signal transduction histidine kinase